MKVLIVGAGPTGLTAAVELARRGVIPTVVDGRDAASLFSRAVGITPKSLRYLEPAGVAPRLIEEGIAMRAANVYLGDRLAVTIPIRSRHAGFPYLLGLPQDRTEAILAETLESFGGTVRYGLRVDTVIPQDRGAVVEFADGTVDAFDIVVGADGVRSTVREAGGFDYPGIDLDDPWSIADVDAANWRHAGEFSLFRAGPGRVVIVAPIGTSRYRVVATTPDALATLPVPMDVTNVRRAATFELAVRQTSSYSRGDIHLAGDAAHCHSPVGGRGMNLGIADASTLAAAIVDGDLENYSPIRHRVAAEAIAMTERGRRLITSRRRAPARFFAGLLAMLRILGPLRRRAGRFLVEF